VSGFGYSVLGFGSHPSRGPAALSISLNKGGLDPLELAGPNGAHPLDSGAGQIDVTASAAGGDGSYTFAWTLTEEGDSGNVLAVLAAGTTNAAQYNTLTVRSTASAGAAPAEVNLVIKCTVTDGNSDTAEITISQPVVCINLG
jgi:hypothetical protein